MGSVSYRFEANSTGDNLFSHPGVSLRAHLEGVGEAAYKFAREAPLNLPFPQGTLGEVAWLMGHYHDLGKATPFFQEYLQETAPERKALLKNQKETRHSLVSAVATYFAVQICMEKHPILQGWRDFLPVAAFIAVKRHHGGLEPLLDEVALGMDTDTLLLQTRHLPVEYLSFLPYWDRVYPNLKSLPASWHPNKFSILRLLRRIKGQEEELFPYLLQNLLFSFLLDADKQITVLGGTFPRAQPASDVVDRYRTLQGFDRPLTPINQLRNAIYTEAITHLDQLSLKEANILSLTAPTGSGKTLTALSFALKLRERIEAQMGYPPRILYALPFLSIIDQNAAVFRDVFEKVEGRLPTSDLVLVHHHLSDIVYTRQDNEYEPEEAEILIEGWNSEIVVTTFVQFFHTLFSNRNPSLRKFHKIAGAIVILDEIQSFPHKYWLLFQQTAKALHHYFNTKFLLFTATQPAIFQAPREILSNKGSYFKSLDRMNLRIRIQSPRTIPQLGEILLRKLREEPKDTLVVLNTIRAAEELYKFIRAPLGELDIEPFFLSSHVIPQERLRRIERIKASKNPKMVVSTQLVEAGVDLDFQWVIRDLGPLDTINQVAGRCNRNLGEQKGLVELILLADKDGRKFHSYIYDGLLVSLTREVLKGLEEVSENALLELIEDYFHRARERITDDESRSVLQALRELDYEHIKGFRLIEELYGGKVDIFVEVDAEAHKIWERFCAIRDIPDRWERRAAFKAIRGAFYPYVISVQGQKAIQNLPPEVCGIRYVPQGQINLWYDLEMGFKAGSGEGAWLF